MIKLRNSPSGPVVLTLGANVLFRRVLDPIWGDNESEALPSDRTTLEIGTATLEAPKADRSYQFAFDAQVGIGEGADDTAWVTATFETSIDGGETWVERANINTALLSSGGVPTAGNGYVARINAKTLTVQGSALGISNAESLMVRVSLSSSYIEEGSRTGLQNVTWLTPNDPFSGGADAHIEIAESFND